MIIDLLNNKIVEMQELRRLEAIKEGQAQQTITDAKYRAFVQDTHRMVEAILYADNKLNFIISDSTKEQIKELLLKSQEVIKSGFAEKDLLTIAQRILNVVFRIIKEEWEIHFKQITTATIKTLTVISAIDKDKVTKCKENIDNAEQWKNEKNVLEGLSNALEEAKKLIQSLNLDEKIVSFLTKMNSGKATIADLDDVVLKWFKDEKLETRIKLVFS